MTLLSGVFDLGITIITALSPWYIYTVYGTKEGYIIMLNWNVYVHKPEGDSFVGRMPIYEADVQYAALLLMHSFLFDETFENIFRIIRCNSDRKHNTFVEIKFSDNNEKLNIVMRQILIKIWHVTVTL